MIPVTANATEVNALREALAATPVGEVCTFDTLDTALGAPVRARRYLLLVALRQLNTDTGAIFGSVRCVGYQRLPADDAHTLGSTVRASVRRRSRRTSSSIANAVNAANDLTPAGRRRASGEIATLNMLAHIATDRTAKAAERDDKPPTLAESLGGVLRHLGVKDAA